MSQAFGSLVLSGCDLALRHPMALVLALVLALAVTHAVLVLVHVTVGLALCIIIPTLLALMHTRPCCDTNTVGAQP